MLDSRFVKWLTIPLLLMSVALSLPRLSESIWSDEWWTLYYIGATAQSGAPEIPQTLARVVGQSHELNPPAYYVMLTIWYNWVGGSELALRWFSVLVGVLTVVLVFRLGATLLSPREGFYAAALFAGGAFWLNYFHDMRMYTLSTLLAVMVFWFAWRLQHIRRPFFCAVMLCVSAVLLLYTHYFAATILAAIGAYFLARRRHLLWGFLALALAGVALLPWLRVTLQAVSEAQGSIRATVDRYSFIDAVRHLLSMFSNVNALLLLLLMLIAARWRRVGGYKFIWAVLLSGFATLWVIHLAVPILTEKRYLLHLFPLLALIGAMGIEVLAQRGIPPRWVVGLWLGAGIFAIYDPIAQDNIQMADWHPPIKPFAASIADTAQTGDRALFFLPEGAMRANVPQLIVHYTQPLGVEGRLVPANDATLDSFYYSQVQAALQNSNRLWIGYERERRTYRLGYVEETLLDEAGYDLCGVVADKPQTYAALYAHGATQPLGVLGNVTLGLVGDVTYRTPNTVTMALGWQLEQALPADVYSVAVHALLNGAVVAQADFALTQNAQNCQLVQLELPADVGAQALTWRVLIYDWRDGERLRTSNGEDGLNIPLQ